MHNPQDSDSDSRDSDSDSWDSDSDSWDSDSDSGILTVNGSVNKW